MIFERVLCNSEKMIVMQSIFLSFTFMHIQVALQIHIQVALQIISSAVGIRFQFRTLLDLFRRFS
jgi:hypothetical protein